MSQTALELHEIKHCWMLGNDLEFLRLESGSRDPFLQVLVSVLVLNLGVLVLVLVLEPQSLGLGLGLR